MVMFVLTVGVVVIIVMTVVVLLCPYVGDRSFTRPISEREKQICFYV